MVGCLGVTDTCCLLSFGDAVSMTSESSVRTRQSPGVDTLGSHDGTYAVDERVRSQLLAAGWGAAVRRSRQQATGHVRAQRHLPAVLLSSQFGTSC